MLFMFLAGVGAVIAAGSWLALYRNVTADRPTGNTLPEVGGIYAVRMLGRDRDMTHHYRVTSFWRVLERDGEHVVVEQDGGASSFDLMMGSVSPRREVWVTDHQIWTAADKLRKALGPFGEP